MTWNAFYLFRVEVRCNVYMVVIFSNLSFEAGKPNIIIQFFNIHDIHEN